MLVFMFELFAIFCKNNKNVHTINEFNDFIYFLIKSMMCEFFMMLVYINMILDGKIRQKGREIVIMQIAFCIFVK